MTGLSRRLADIACRLLVAMLPPSMRDWGRAIEAEAAAIADDGVALRFALGSAAGLIPGMIAGHSSTATPESMPEMQNSSILRDPRCSGLACAIGATALGCAYMTAAGAPVRYVAINAGALAIGLMLFLGLRATPSSALPRVGLVVLSAMLVGTALFGHRVEDAARWITIGGIVIQPSLVLVPPMLVLFARMRTTVSTMAIVLAALALALQPDRAMAGMLAAACAALMALRRDRHTGIAAMASLLAFAATVIRPDTLPAVPYVDRILHSAFDIHALAGAAVVGGSALLILPAIIGGLHDTGGRAAYTVFGIAWLSAVVAAALGNYPTPIVGYGGSAIIGYVLSLSALPRRARNGIRTATSPRAGSDTARTPDLHRRIGLAHSG